MLLQRSPAVSSLKLEFETSHTRTRVSRVARAVNVVFRLLCLMDGTEKAGEATMMTSRKVRGGRVDGINQT